MSTCFPELLCLERLSVVKSSCVSQERVCLNLCWFSFKIVCESSCLKMIDATTMSSSILEGAQWLSDRVLDWRPRAVGSSLTGLTALWSLSKTHLS